MGNPQPDPDALLLHQLQTGNVNEAAWREFLNRIRRWICRHYPMLYPQADDLAGEAAVCAFESLPSFHGEARFIRWVHRIAYHIVCRHLRKQGDAVVLSFEDLSDEIAAADEINRQMFQLAANSALQTLTDQERTVFLLRVERDMDHKEIARLLGISYNTSRQTWMRASEKIGRYRQQNQC